ncbi:sigma factor-like helix-turn-helix DNA-binding protein [Saccharothrix syringae]|uniref:RNA polymerase sigma factor 70 region 4 type 2 domain-containing protein n=1 Tax=Saccharothrix syringae TaxID=103733 RepID=A0A5Q0H3Z1_SACSY|nr:sigma factor-like helix-turn-helix DNA-binding protein [Saccharothrix syringae]QFZ20520.1 hypothetical protein EKG83_26710 [Saccharothrix syringae]
MTLVEFSRGLAITADYEVGDEEQFWRLTVRMLLARLRGKIPYNDLGDVVQDAMTKFFTRLTPAQREDILDLWAYLNKVAANAAVDYYRAHKMEIPVDSWDEFKVVEPGKLVHDPFVDHAQKLHLLGVAARVAPDMADALELFLDGYELIEVADMTGKSQKEIHSAFRKVALQLDLRHEAENASVVNPPEGRNELARAVQGLGERQAEVLRLSADGLKPRVIAKILGIDSNAVRASKSIALKTLRDQLGLVNSAEVLNRVREISWGSRLSFAS